jgi:hypothetical protein
MQKSYKGYQPETMNGQGNLSSSPPGGQDGVNLASNNLEINNEAYNNPNVMVSIESVYL